ncbi:MAG: PDZ domain-containing protein [Candidatus Eisenbacteria bacterium]
MHGRSRAPIAQRVVDHALSTLVLAALVMPLIAATARAEAQPQFLRRPDIHGDAIVFTSEGDLWLGSISGHSATRITSADGSESAASFSPDGKTIAFSAQYDGGYDVYVMDVTGGAPRRLTWDPFGALALGWTSDGKEVLFRSSRRNPGRRSELWAVSAAGGSPRVLPIPYIEFAAMDDAGSRVAYVPISAEWQHWKRYRGGEADDIWLADLKSGAFRRLTDDAGVDTEPQWVGNSIYFVSERDGLANLYRLDPQSGAVQAATRFTDYDVRYPGTDGKKLIFEHGNGLALFDPATNKAEDLELDLHSDRLHTRPRIVSAMQNLFSVTFGPTGKRLLVSARGQILSAPVEHGDVRVVMAQDGSRCQYPCWSPDGKQMAFVSDKSGEEQVWLAPAAGGEAKQLTRDHVGPLGQLLWSPDGKWIATNDREFSILLIDAKSGAMVLVDECPQGSSYNLTNESYRFSPDGKWLTYARIEDSLNWAVHLYEIATKKDVLVTDPEMSCYSPAFDAAGKFLYYLADRDFDPRYVGASHYFAFDRYTKPVALALAADSKSPFLDENDVEGEPKDADDANKDDKKDEKKSDKKGEKKDDSAAELPATKVDLEGLTSRVMDVPVAADHYWSIEGVEGRLLLASWEPAVGDEPGTNRLRAYVLEDKKLKVVVEKMGGYQLSGDSKKLLIRDDQNFTVMDATADEMPSDKGKVDTAGWNLTIDPVSEWRQIFHEAWRIGRDFFYDPSLHGVDWPAVRAKLEALLPAVADRSDLNFLLGEMIAELNCGHAYVFGGDQPGAPHQPMGFLGADLEPVNGANAAYKVVKIFPGDGFDLEARSPLLTPGSSVKVGEYILAVAGQPIRAYQDIQALLAGTAGFTIALTVNSKPSLDGAREVLVKPMNSERGARYYDWVASRVAYVREHGGENLGYVHIPDMSSGGFREFAKHYYSNLGKDGIVYDVRFNGGGYINAMLLLQMSSKPYSYFKPRHGKSWSRQDWSFPGYSAALVNDGSGSNAEEFCDAFQRLELGPVIGTRSWGGEVGSGGGYALVDGGALFIPNYAAWTPGMVGSSKAAASIPTWWSRMTRPR